MPMTLQRKYLPVAAPATSRLSNYISWPPSTPTFPPPTLPRTSV